MPRGRKPKQRVSDREVDLRAIRVMLDGMRQQISDSIVDATEANDTTDPMAFYMIHSWCKFKDSFDDVIAYIDQQIEMDRELFNMYDD